MAVKISPSLLAADFARLAEEIASVEAGGADSLHVDIMDGHYVPNITIGPVVVQAISRVAKVPLDVHLMISDPAQYAEDFARAGAASLAFHPDAVDAPMEVVKLIKGLGVKVGIAVNPDLAIDAFLPFFPMADFLLMMTVCPGFGGQEFMESSLENVRAARAAFSGDIAVDGGVSTHTAGAIARAGGNVLVAGTSVFSSGDRRAAIADLRRAAEDKG